MEERYCRSCVFCNNETSAAEAEWGIDSYECGMYFCRISPDRRACQYYERDYDKYDY